LPPSLCQLVTTPSSIRTANDASPSGRKSDPLDLVLRFADNCRLDTRPTRPCRRLSAVTLPPERTADRPLH
jgi:hypothetical protein